VLCLLLCHGGGVYGLVVMTVHGVVVVMLVLLTLVALTLVHNHFLEFI
jgi:hypothetical protein